MKDLVNDYPSANKIRKTILVVSIIAYVIFVMEFFISYISYPCYVNDGYRWVYSYHDSIIPIELLFNNNHDNYGQGTYIFELKVGIFTLMVALFIVATKYLIVLIAKRNTDESELVINAHKLLSLSFWFTGLYYLSALILTEVFVHIVHYNYAFIMNGSIIPFIFALILRFVFNISVMRIKKLTGEDYLIYKRKWNFRIAFIIITTTIVEFLLFFISLRSSDNVSTTCSNIMIVVLVVCVIEVVKLYRQKNAFYLIEKEKELENEVKQGSILLKNKVEQSSNADKNKECLWQSNVLKKKNERIQIREKLSLTEFADKIHKQINNSGILISEDEVKNLLSAMASSRVILLNVNNYDLARNFSEILNDCFSSELFTENYIETNKDSADKTELTANQIKLNNKYSVESGVYVAYYMNNFITTIFFDGCEDTPSVKAKNYFETVAKAEEYVYLGKLDYLEENKEFSKGRMLISDNLWVMGFVNNDSLSNILQEDWTNYATVVDLDISKKEVEENEEWIQIPYPNFVQEVEEVQEAYYLYEANWKKFDKLDEYLVKILGYGFENRFIRQIEKFVSTYISMGGTQEKAIDEVLSMRILPWLAGKREILVSETVGDFALVVSEIFGGDAIPKAKGSLIRFELKR